MDQDTGNKAKGVVTWLEQKQSSVAGEGAPAELRELVQRFRVCWEVGPEDSYREGEKLKIGFTLDLIGTHEPEVKHPDPGCEHCRRVYSALKKIAGWIIPKEERPTVYEIEPYRQAISYSHSRHDRPDVTLTIRIEHRSDFDRPVDDCEVRCLNEMKQRLKELGARERNW
jgi:hypothetical protein